MVIKYTNPNKAKNTKDIYLRLIINILVGREDWGPLEGIRGEGREGRIINH
jgi:hypothetical protein